MVGKKVAVSDVNRQTEELFEQNAYFCAHIVWTLVIAETGASINLNPKYTTTRFYFGHRGKAKKLIDSFEVMKSTQSVKSSEIKQVDEPKTGKVSEANKVNEVNELSRDRSNSSKPSELVTFGEKVQKVQIEVQKKQENKQQRDVSNKVLTNGSAAKPVISDKMKARIAMFERE